jgi:hypothetical protein
MNAVPNNAVPTNAVPTSPALAVRRSVSPPPVRLIRKRLHAARGGARE